MGIIDDVLGAAMGGNRPNQAGGNQVGPMGAGAGGMLGGMLGGVGGQGMGGGTMPLIATALSALLGSGTAGGLGGLLDKLRAGGIGPQVDSWVGNGPNMAVAPGQMQQALGPELLDRLQGVTGLSHEDLSAHLAQHMPEVVNRMTPQGSLDQGTVEV